MPPSASLSAGLIPRRFYVRRTIGSLACNCEALIQPATQLLYFKSRLRICRMCATKMSFKDCAKIQLMRQLQFYFLSITIWNESLNFHFTFFPSIAKLCVQPDPCDLFCPPLLGFLHFLPLRSHTISQSL